VFVNGSLVNELSKIIEKDNSIVISSLATARKNNQAIFNQHFGKYAKIEGQAMNALNTALLSDGAFVFVPKGKTVAHPVVIFNISDASDLNVLAQPRNLIVVEEQSTLTIVETYYATGTNASFTNVVTRMLMLSIIKFNNKQVPVTKIISPNFFRKLIPILTM
jgi:Fe-S cluster assembly protein SufD